MSRLESSGWDALVVLFYSPVILGALLWLVRLGGEWAVWRRTIGEQPLRDVVIGLGVGLALVGLTRLLAQLGPGRAMVDTLRREMGHLGPGSWAVMAVSSAVGEELLFRAVLQPIWGVWLASGLFALAHVPYERSLWPWPFFAFGAGLVFGGLYSLTGAVCAGVVAHALVNGINLWWICGASTDSATSSP